MSVQSILAVKDGDTLGAVRGLLKSLLETNVVDALLVPLEVPSADKVTPILVQDTAALDKANPLAPVMRVNAAAMLARMQRDNQALRVGAVLRPCELRATIELAKVDRVDLRHVTLIGVDCMGTYEASDYGQLARASAESPMDDLMRWTRQGPIAPYRLRNACQMCEHFTAEGADVAVGMIGMNVRERLLVQTREDVASKLGLTPGEPNGRDKAIARLSSIRHHRRDEALTNATQLLADLPSLIGIVAACTACGECEDACPYCNCDAFMPKPAKEAHADRLSVWPGGNSTLNAKRDRHMGIFSDLVQMGRRAASCVGCGMCESACSRHAPLTALQAALGHKVQQEFNYVPGRRLDEKLPWARA